MPPAATSWAQRQATRHMLLRRDLNRLLREEGPLGRLSLRVAGASAQQDGAGKELSTLDDDESLHPHERDIRHAGVGRMWRMTLVPKRNVWIGGWAVFWNAIQCVRNAAAAVPAAIGAEVHARVQTGSAPIVAVPVGAAMGSWIAVQYLVLGGIVSPILLGVTSILHSLQGVHNAFTGTRYFDANRGYYRRGDSIEYRALRQSREAELLDAMRCFEADHNVHKRQAAAVLKTRRGRLISLVQKTILDRFRRKGDKSINTKHVGMDSATTPADATDYYDVLGINQDASQQEVKAAYTKLAKVFHPDKNPSPEARETFDAITRAYKTLGDPALREAYDMGGETASDSAAALHAERRKQRADAKAKGKTADTRRKYGTVAVVNKEGRLIGRPIEVAQSIFGGLPFSELCFGPLFRSPWHLNQQCNTRVSIADFERVQVYRMERLAYTMTVILDAYAMDSTLGATACQAAARVGILTAAEVEAALKGATTSQPTAKGPAPSLTQKVTTDYALRCDRLATRLSKCAFGAELLCEVGEAYTVGAKRYAGEVPFYAPKKLASSRVLSGLHRVVSALRGELSEKGLDKATAYNLFATEYDNVAADAQIVVRFVIMTAVHDASAGRVALAELRRQLGRPERAPPEPGHAYAGKVVAGGLAVEAANDVFVLFPAPKQKREPGLDAAVDKILQTCEKDPKQREALVNALHEDIVKRRVDALGALGFAFIKHGRRFGFQEMDECTMHMRSTIGTSQNTTVPPIF